MPGFIIKVDDNRWRRSATEADQDNPTPTIQDRLHIVTAGEAASRIILLAFQYNVGIHEIEVYNNGLLLRVVEGAYGDYVETDAFTITFEAGVIVATDELRFRVTSNSYDYAQNNRNDLVQVGMDIFGESYSLENLGARSVRTTGTFTDGDATPDISDYRTWITANTGPTNITTFNGGIEDDRRTILFGDAATTLVDGATLVLAGGVNFNGAAGDTIRFIYIGAVWYEISRSVN